MRFASILSTVADGVMTFDSDGVVDTINPAVVKIFDYQYDDVIGKDINLFIPGLYNRSSEYFFNLSMFGNKEVADATWNTQGRRKDGSTFPIEINVNKYILSGSKKYTLTLRDNTKRKKFEARIAS
jgi:PAS domain S-box-containing protein